MGCFNQSCAFSGLPITAGMPVRYFLLTGNNPAIGSGAVHNTDWWVPRTFPLRAKYNDYGGVEDVQPGIQQDIWIQGFQTDLVEHGTGENECHDVATYKATFDFDSMGTAIHETALFVDPDPGADDREARWAQITTERDSLLADLKAKKETAAALELGVDPPAAPPKHEPGIPTLLSVRDTIIDAGFAVADNWDLPGYLVNELEPGDVTVRWSKISSTEERMMHLDAVRTCLEAADFQAIIVANDMRNPMLRLFPKFGNEQFRGFRQDTTRVRNSDIEKRTPVAQAMVREDVWQMLLSIPLGPGWRFKKKLTLDTHVQFAREVYDAYRAHLVELAEAKARREAGDGLTAGNILLLELYENRFFEYGGKAGLRNNPVMWLMNKMGEGMIQGVALQDHFKLFAASNPTEEEIADFVHVVGEMTHVRALMNAMCKPWIPSFYSNQDTCEREHMQYARGVAKVAREWKRGIDARYAEYEAEDAAWEAASAAKT